MRFRVTPALRCITTKRHCKRAESDDHYATREKGKSYRVILLRASRLIAMLESSDDFCTRRMSFGLLLRN